MSISVKLFLVVTMSVEAVLGGNWYYFRLLRNPGLLTDTATSADDCINKCVAMSNCSAVSYKATTNVCIQSVCNSLDLFQNKGWHTYVVVPAYVETRDFPSPNFEWMLTDSCGNLNLGATNGPKITLTSVTYVPSPSVYAGNVPKFAGSASTGVSDTNAVINNPTLSYPMAVMLWVNFDVLQDTTLFEFFAGGTRAIYFMYYQSNFHVGDPYCSASACSYSQSFAAKTGVWNHFAFTLSNNQMQFYLNSSFLASISPTNFLNPVTWNTVRINRIYGYARMYCYKVFYNVILTGDQIAAAAQSCNVGKIRLSN